eukprot:357967-Chlamydomonas_euryale.AAC.2
MHMRSFHAERRKAGEAFHCGPLLGNPVAPFGPRQLTGWWARAHTSCITHGAKCTFVQKTSVNCMDAIAQGILDTLMADSLSALWENLALDACHLRGGAALTHDRLIDQSWHPSDDVWKGRVSKFIHAKARNPAADVWASEDQDIQDLGPELDHMGNYLVKATVAFVHYAATILGSVPTLMKDMQKNSKSFVDDGLPCQVCNKTDYASVDMIVCDDCENYWHLTCLEPPLTEVPEGEWQCATCAALPSTSGYKKRSRQESTCPDELQGQVLDYMRHNEGNITKGDLLHPFMNLVDGAMHYCGVPTQHVVKLARHINGAPKLDEAARQHINALARFFGVNPLKVAFEDPRRLQAIQSGACNAILIAKDNTLKAYFGKIKDIVKDMTEHFQLYKSAMAGGLPDAAGEGDTVFLTPTALCKFLKRLDAGQVYRLGFGHGSELTRLDNVATFDSWLVAGTFLQKVQYLLLTGEPVPDATSVKKSSALQAWKKQLGKTTSKREIQSMRGDKPAVERPYASIANAAGGGGAMRMAPQLAMAAGAGAVAAATEAMATANPGHANAAMHMLPPQAVQMHSFNQIAQQVAQQAAQSAVQQVANMFTQQQLAQHPTQPFPQQFGQPFAQLPVLPFAQQYGQQGAGMGAIGHAGSTLVTHADLLSMQQNLFQNLSQQMTQQMQAHAASTHISMQHLTGVLASGLQAIEMQTVMSSASLGASSSAPTANPNDIVSPSGHGQHRLARHMDRQTALTLAQRKVLAHNSPQQPSSPDPTHPEERNMLLELEAAINPPPTEQAGIPQLAAANVPELQATTMNQLVVLSPNQASQGGRVTMLTVAMIKQRPTVKPVDVELPTTVTFNSSWDIPNSVGAGKSQRWDSWHGYQLQSMTMADVLDDWSVGVKVSPRRPEHAEPPAADHGNSHRIAPLCFLELAHPAIAAAWRTGQVRKVVMMIKALVYAVHMRVFGLPFSITDMPKPPMPLLDAANDVMTLDGKTMTLSRLANKGLKHQWTPINYEKYLAEQGLLKTLLMPTNTWGP